MLSCLTLPHSLKKEKTLRTNLEIEDITFLSTNHVYLMNKNNLLVKTDIFIEEDTKEEQIKSIINYLTLDNQSTPTGLKGYIPENTKINNVVIDKKHVWIDFSKEFLNNTEEESLIITGIVYSILDIEELEELSITVEEQYISGYEEKLTKKIGINKEYQLKSTNNIEKVVIYYIDLIDNNSYYVPITKYINDNREKVEIIVDELKSTSTYHVISYLNPEVELLDYKEETNTLFLNFNKAFLETNKTIQQKTLNTIAYSIFDNYDVNLIIFEVENKEIDYMKRI